jgi:dihydrolipoamide dehydrogenase
MERSVLMYLDLNTSYKGKMAEIVIMPKLGFNMSEGKLVQWYKKEGESITKGENFFSIETDKTNMDIEATRDGVVIREFIGVGETLAVTLPIAVIGDAGEDASSLIAEAEAQLGGKAAPAAPQKAAAGEAQEAAPAGDAYDYDVAVIGGGPGGYEAAIKAAQSGRKTVIIEKEKLGGTCLNVGCVPTKTLLMSAASLEAVKRSADFGVIDTDASRATLDMKKVQKRKAGVVSQLVGGVGALMRSNGVTVENGEGVLTDTHTINVGGKSITAADVIIATGSVSKSLPISISDKMEVITSTEMLDLDDIPEEMVIIGGGVIGVEFAYFLATIGTKVTIVEFLDRIINMVDREITDKVTKQLEGMGIVIHTSAKVTAITDKAVVFEKDGKEQSVETKKVLMSVGRGPRLDGIDTEKLGLETNRGAIVTDEHLRTNIPHVYAIGDVNGRSMLAHTASMEGITAVENICGGNAAMDYSKIPSAIYIEPEIAAVGMTEEQAKEKYGEVKVGKFPLMANAKAKAEGEERGMVKVIIEPKYGEILGVHLYCIHATDMIAEAAAAMKLESTAAEFTHIVHPHPTISETLLEAMHAAADGRAINF